MQEGPCRVFEAAKDNARAGLNSVPGISRCSVNAVIILLIVVTVVISIHCQPKFCKPGPHMSVLHWKRLNVCIHVYVVFVCVLKSKVEGRPLMISIAFCKHEECLVSDRD